MATPSTEAAGPAAATSAVAPPTAPETNQGTGWYPGKYLKMAHRNLSNRMADVKAAKAKGQYQFPRRPLLALHSAVKGRRRLATRSESDGGSPPCGHLFFSIVGGRYRTTRAYWTGELDGNECRTSVASCTSPTWEDEEFTLPIFNPSSDLLLFLYDNEAADNNKPVGRVILPLPSLCRGMRPSSLARTRHLVLRVMPTGNQHSPSLLARYDEACPGLPGSGMVRPLKEIGTVEILLAVRLDAPLSSRFGMLAAYAMAPPPGEIDDDADDDAEEAGGGGSGGGSGGGGGGVSSSARGNQLQPKLLKLNALRFSRCLGRPHLLRGPPALLLPAFLYLACFRLPLAALPWLILLLALANGVLARTRRAELTSSFVFWEGDIGESSTPKGIFAKLKLLTSLLAKLQYALGVAATAMERSQNTLNWEEPPVTITVIGLLAVLAALSSVTLAIVPLPALVFALGLLALSPFLTDALRELGGGPAGVKGATTEASPPSSAKSATTARAVAALPIVAALRNVLARVPDGRDVAHRHFAMSEQVVQADFAVAALATAPVTSVGGQQQPAAGPMKGKGNKVHHE
jgi:hypothetical protein